LVGHIREDRRLRVFENMVLRRILGPRRDEITGEWRKLRNGSSGSGKGRHGLD